MVFSLSALDHSGVGSEHAVLQAAGEASSRITPGLMFRAKEAEFYPESH